MAAYILDWLNLLVRWLHVIAGIAWIGSSFYFIWLDNHLRSPADPADDDKGVGGEVWSVHGGGFYHAQKYRVAPGKLPETLHWFKWEAYVTCRCRPVTGRRGADLDRFHRRRLGDLRPVVQVAPGR